MKNLLLPKRAGEPINPFVVPYRPVPQPDYEAWRRDSVIETVGEDLLGSVAKR